MEYRVKSLAAAMIKAGIIYGNETGGSTTGEDAALPFSVKFKRNVNIGDAIAISGYAEVAGSLELEIRIDDKVVKNRSFQGTSIVTGSIAHVFQ